MSQNYSNARIAQGFKELLDQLRQTERPDDTTKRIRANTLARQAAQERVRIEYAAFGCEPPSIDALSITARRVLGMSLPEFVPREMNSEEDAA